MQTQFTGRTIISLDTVDSTNNYAKELLLRETPPEGTIVIAREQYSGRGQMGSDWKTESGKNLTLSIILYPVFLAPEKQFYLNIAISLAVKDFCESKVCDEIQIKWPNDIYYRDKKLGGILIENTLHGNRISSSVIGIGINVNQTEFEASLPNPTSLSLICNLLFPHSDLPAELSAFIEKYYLQLRQEHYNFLEKAYTDSLYRYQQTHAFKKGEQIFKGEISGVTKEGKLIIDSNGKQLKFGFKEIEFVI